MPFRADLSLGSNRRVVITGIGLRTPLGADRESTWRSLVAGHSASRWLQSPQWTGPTPLVGAPCEMPLSVTERGLDPVIALALEASNEAIGDAGLDVGKLAADSTGVVFGTSKGSLHTASGLLSDSYSGSSADQWLSVWPNAAAAAISRVYGSLGPTLAPVAACATGLAACLRGFELIRDGRCDVVLAGSSDASLQPAILGSFQRLGVLARPTENPATACRPFDRHRSGFIVGEGAGCLVLESLEHAVARGARWYAEWESGRMLSDPSGLTQLDPQGLSLQRLFRDLHKEVGELPDYMNLHGTATLPNDRVESAAIRAVLGTDADGISCSSLKGGLGHLLGAAGSVELAASLLAIRDQTVPPTVNLETADPELTLDFTPRQSRQRRIDRVWKLSLGFGGHLSAASICRLRGVGDRTN
ncbi:MAG: beta-ketoacyl-[acyl-carrier-protein] synthase family protein [Schlesneria sp.]|nr:beta-ketoacyl-[acyl-carrier-protein] synthase family protein [Schlesneria sp.]